LTEKYFSIREVIKMYRNIPKGVPPPSTPKFAYGQVEMKKLNTVSESLDVLSFSGPLKTLYPPSFTDLNQAFGFVLYQTVLPIDCLKPTPLSSPLNGVHDRAYISINGVAVGILERDKALTINITGKAGSRVDILGLVSNLTLGADVLENWMVYSLSIDEAVCQGLVKCGLMDLTWVAIGHPVGHRSRSLSQLTFSALLSKTT
ncbi:hypothetical protein DNTS_029103, partial [Danionella cerebrum]